MENSNNILNESRSFEELLDLKYGKTGTKERDAFEQKSKAFMIGEMLKAARAESGLSQQELAERTGTKKSYISRVENGKIDIQLSTLFRIFEEGLGRQIMLSYA